MTTAHLLGRARQAGRFPTAAAFATYADVAPVEIASFDHAGVAEVIFTDAEATGSEPAARVVGLAEWWLPESMSVSTRRMPL